MKMQNLASLGAHFLEQSKTRGALRLLKAGEPLSRAEGLYFLCPGCRKNYVTLLFDLPSVPPEIAPPGRWKRLETTSLQLRHLSLDRKVECGCGFQGNVAGGQIHWT